MRARTRWAAGLAAAVILLTAAVSAYGYTGQVPATATVSVGGTVACNDAFTVTGTFLDLEGQPVAGLSVEWSFLTDQSTEDTIHQTVTITDEAGVAATTVTLAAVPGDRRIGVTSGEVSASAVVSQSCAGLSLPRTSTLPEGTSGGGSPGLVLLLAALAFVTGTAVTLRRRARPD